MIEVVLGWPPTDLSPNARKHWAVVAKAKKQYRRDCYSVSKEQLKKYKKETENIPERLVLEMTFIPPDRRSYDRDNLVARMKSGIDGLADALKINDKRFVRIRILQEIPYGKKSKEPISQDTRICERRS